MSSIYRILLAILLYTIEMNSLKLDFKVNIGVKLNFIPQPSIISLVGSIKNHKADATIKHPAIRKSG